MSDEKKDRGFEVKDHRIGSQDDEQKAEAEAPETKETPEQEPVGEEKQETREPRQEAPPLPRITFPAFLLSLNTSALIHLGLVPIPGTDQVEKNISLAKQTIDLLDLIKEKTKGNLTQEESDLLENLVFDLKIKYVELGKEQ
jgi:hypothetical protein